MGSQNREGAGPLGVGGAMVASGETRKKDARRGQRALEVPPASEPGISRRTAMSPEQPWARRGSLRRVLLALLGGGLVGLRVLLLEGAQGLRLPPEHGEAGAGHDAAHGEAARGGGGGARGEGPKPRDGPETRERAGGGEHALVRGGVLPGHGVH